MLHDNDSPEAARLSLSTYSVDGLRGPAAVQTPRGGEMNPRMQCIRGFFVGRELVPCSRFRRTRGSHERSGRAEALGAEHEGALLPQTLNMEDLHGC